MNWLLLLVFAFGPVMNGNRLRAKTRVNEGIRLEAKNNTAEAVTKLKEAVAFDADYAKAHFTLGQLYRKQGNLSDAQAALEAALRVVDSDESFASEIAYTLGVTISGRSEETGLSFAKRTTFKQRAVNAFDKSVRRNPKHYKAYHRRARLHAWLGDPRAADHDLRRCIEIKPRFSPCFVSLSHLYADYGFGNLALSVAEVGVQVNDVSAEMWSGLGQLHLSLNRPEDAIDAYKKARAIDPDMTDVLYGLGMAHADLRNRKDSVESLQAFLQKAGSEVPESRKRAANDTIARMQDVI